jgi:hypothetical protein
MNCPDGSVCFRKESFGVWVVALLIVFVFLYYKLGRKMDKNVQLREKIDQLQSKIADLRGAVDNESDKQAKKEMRDDIRRFEKEKEMYYKRLGDPLEVPNQTYEFTRGVYNNVDRYQPKQMVNVPTRGVATDFQPIGVLTNVDSKKNPNILQLFGRPLWIGSNKWQYYTSSDNYQSVKIQIMNKRQECLTDLGCQEIYTGDIVHVPSYGMDFKVDLYQMDKPRYIPYLI